MPLILHNWRREPESQMRWPCSLRNPQGEVVIHERVWYVVTACEPKGAEWLLTLRRK